MKTEPLFCSFRYALSGLVYVVRSQRNAKIHLVIALGVMLTGAVLKLSRLEFAILVLTVGSVFAAEIANTVVETLVDLVSPERNELARVTKDAAAAAVFCLASMSIGIGLLLLGPPAYERLFG